MLFIDCTHISFDKLKLKLKFERKFQRKFQRKFKRKFKTKFKKNRPKLQHFPNKKGVEAVR